MPGTRYTTSNPDGESFVPDAERFAFQQRSQQMQDRIAMAMLADRERDRQLSLAQGGTFADRASLAHQQSQDQFAGQGGLLDKSLAGQQAVAHIGNEVPLGQLKFEQDRYAHEAPLIDARNQAEADNINAQAQIRKMVYGQLMPAGATPAAASGAPAAPMPQPKYDLSNPIDREIQANDQADLAQAKDPQYQGMLADFGLAPAAAAKPAAGGGAQPGGGLLDSLDPQERLGTLMSMAFPGTQVPDYEAKRMQHLQNDMLTKTLSRQAAVNDLPEDPASLQTRLERAVGQFQERDHSLNPFADDPGQEDQDRIVGMRTELAKAIVAKTGLTLAAATQKANQIIRDQLASYGSNWQNGWLSDETRNLNDALGQ